MKEFSEFRLWEPPAPLAEAGDEKRVEHRNPSPDGLGRITDVTTPTLTWFPSSEAGIRPAVVVLPGGGYCTLAWNHEGINTCNLLNLNGFSAFLLKYRCPDRRKAAYADAARAIRLIRARAEEFRINPDQVGVIGYSAGAHLAAMVSASAKEEPYPAADEIDRLNFRPNFSALIYPAYLADCDTGTVLPEFKITPEVPPTFILQAEDDFIRVENALTWYLALKNAGVPAEMHLYEQGGHGYALRRTGSPISEWGELAGKWFRRQAGIQ